MVEDALFNNAFQALTFAFRFSAEQYDRPLMNKLADKGSRPGKGLAGINGAGQSGMIRREVKALGPLYEAIVIASFAPHSVPCQCKAACCSGEKINKEWSEAIYVITDAAMMQLSGRLSHYQLRRGIVERQFGVKKTLTDLATKCGVDRDTASHHNAILTTWLSGDKKRDVPNAKIGEIERALSAARVSLSDAGII